MPAGTLGAISMGMVETWISLKIVLLMVIGILAIDELYVGIQTAETVNFHASRSSVVGLDAKRVDDSFNHSLLHFMIFTKRNPFIRMGKVRTSTTETDLKTHLHFHDFAYEASTTKVVHP